MSPRPSAGGRLAGTMSALVRPLRYPAIDGIRCYAAAMVFMVHYFGSVAVEVLGIPQAAFAMTSPDPSTALLAYLADGHHGVDVFFVVSGFLMARAVVRPGGPPGYLGFMRNRFRRIYPAFLGTLALAVALRCLAFGWPFQPLDFALNLVFANALPGSQVLAYNFVSWSLGYEFAFYLVVPLLGTLAAAADRRLAGLAFLVAAFALLPGAVFRALSLFAGAFVGCFRDDELEAAARRIPLLLVGPAYLLLSPLKGLEMVSYRGFYLAFLAVTPLLFVRLVYGGGLLAGLLQRPAVRALGTLSYSFYLVHTLALAMGYHWIVAPLRAAMPLALLLPLYLAASLAIALAAAWASFRLFEQPYFARRRHPAGPARAEGNPG